MPWQFDLVVPGPPIGKGRPRFSRASGRAYTPKGTAEWERACAMLARSEWRDAPLDDLSCLEVTAVMPRPKRLLRKKDPEGRILCGAKPDADNILKIVADSLQLAGVVRRDETIVQMSICKYYASKIEGACVEIRLTPAKT